MNTPEERLRRQLEALPEPPLPETLWRALHAQHRSRVRTHRLALVGSVGVAGLLALSPLLQPDGGRDQPVVSAPVAAPRIHTTAAMSPLRVVDAAIQNAYDEGASDDEIQPLWEARQRLMTLQATQYQYKPDPPHS